MTATIYDYLGIKLTPAEASAIQQHMKQCNVANANAREYYQVLRDDGFPICGTGLVKRLQSKKPSALPSFIPAKYNVKPEHSDLHIVLDRFVQASLLELEEELDFCTAVQMFSSVSKFLVSLDDRFTNAFVCLIGVRYWRTLIIEWTNSPAGNCFSEKIQSREHADLGHELDVTANKIAPLVLHPVHPLDAFEITGRFPADFKADDLNDLQWKNLVSRWQKDFGDGMRPDSQDEIPRDSLSRISELLSDLKAFEITIQPNRRHRMEDHQNYKLSNAVHCFRNEIDRIPLPHIARVELEDEFKSVSNRMHKEGIIGVIGKAHHWIEARATIAAAEAWYCRHAFNRR